MLITLARERNNVSYLSNKSNQDATFQISVIDGHAKLLIVQEVYQAIM